jgi:hypothetical protein
MADKPKRGAGVSLQPQPKVIDNPPAKTVGGALAGGKRQVNAAK